MEQLTQWVYDAILAITPDNGGNDPTARRRADAVHAAVINAHADVIGIYGTDWWANLLAKLKNRDTKHNYPFSYLPITSKRRHLCLKVWQYFPVECAYNYARKLNNPEFSAIIDYIEGDAWTIDRNKFPKIANGDNDSVNFRRGHIIRLFEKDGILDTFLADYWPIAYRGPYNKFITRWRNISLENSQITRIDPIQSMKIVS